MISFSGTVPGACRACRDDEFVMLRSLFRRLLPAAIACGVVVVAACSSGQKKPEYYEAKETQPLKLPEGMDPPDRSAALIINAPYMPPPAMVMETRPPRISSTTSGLNANSSFKWSPEGLYLLVDDTPDSTHRRLGLVLKRTGMQNIREDEKGVYRFDYYQVFEEKDGLFSKLAFWSRDKSEDYSGAYQVYAAPDGDKTRVYVKYADGTDCEPDAAEHLLAIVRARLG